MEADDAAVRQMAQDYVEDMGALSGAWNYYFEEWSEPRMIADTARFRAATKGVIGALAHRVSREEDTLYPTLTARSGKKDAPDEEDDATP